MMDVVIDGYVFENAGQVGIWRFYFEILHRIARTVDITLWLRNLPAQPIPPGLAVICDEGRIGVSGYDFARRARRSWSRLKPVPRKFRRATLFQSTYFTKCPVAGPTQIVTVYDMIAERLFLGCGDWAKNDIERKRAAIKSAAVCICISHAAAQDLLRFYPDVADRVRVIYPGAEHLLDDLPIESGSKQDRHDAFEYALFVGHREQYKNFQIVLEAMLKPDWPSGLFLHVVGPPLSGNEEALIRFYGLTDRIYCLGRLSEEKLRREYQGAACFIFPSLLEGFGLPILEAQANGSPVVCSDIPVFREVAAGAAAFFDPHSAAQLAETVADTVNTETRRRLTDLGYENVKRFSWDRTARQTLDIYHELAQLRTN
jgi:glycosyltransferase involved in cell wall biosynthesis